MTSYNTSTAGESRLTIDEENAERPDVLSAPLIPNATTGATKRLGSKGPIAHRDSSRDARTTITTTSMSPFELESTNPPVEQSTRPILRSTKAKTALFVWMVMGTLAYIVLLIVSIPPALLSFLLFESPLTVHAIAAEIMFFCGPPFVIRVILRFWKAYREGNDQALKKYSIWPGIFWFLAILCA